MVQQLVGSSSLGLGKLIDGKNQFIHIRYSVKPDGSNMTVEIQPDTKYIGIRTSSSETPSINPADYSWGRFVGTSGSSSYTWIRYSANEDGSNMTTIANEDTKYIGVAITDEDSAPTDHTRYSWALFKGSDGRGVERTEVSYQKSSSGTVIPTGSWSASIPSVNDGEYLWTRTLFFYTDGTTTSTFTVSRNGVAGLGIANTDVHYQKSTNGTTAPTGTWTITIPNVMPNEYLWTRTTITYTDGSSTVSYSVGKMGADGRDAQLLYLTASSQVQAFDENDEPKTTEAIIISAKLQNASGAATFVAIPYIGNTAQPTITLGGTGNDRTLLPSQWTSPKWTSIAITATLGPLTDTISVVKVKDGRTPVVHTAWADSEDGRVGFSLEKPVGKIPKYKGHYVDYSLEASTDPTRYKWERNPDDAGNVADDANDKSDLANQLANAAKELADKAKADAAEANRLLGLANGEIDRLNTDVSNARSELERAESELNSQIETVEIKLTQDYATKTSLSETEITLNKKVSESVASVKQEMSETYAVKTDLTNLSGDYASFKEDTAKKFSQQVSSIETVQTDTETAKKLVNDALSKAQSAITNATNANNLANSALDKASGVADIANSASQTAADAIASANNAIGEANAAKNNADKAIADVAALTKTVTTQGTKIDQTSSKIDLVASSVTEVGNKVDSLKLVGENLILNGYGEFGNNKNFNNYIFDGTNTYNNKPSFKTNLKTTLSIGDSHIPIDIDKAYQFSMNIKSDNGGKIYLGWDEYDIDGYYIGPTYVKGYPNTTTALARDLNNGDTVVYLESTANWVSSDYTHQNGLIFWNYRDSTGYLYPEGVYSRNAWLDLYTKETVNKTNNTITLKSPWTHGTIKAGTRVSQSDSQGHKYRNFANTSAPTSWTKTSFTIGEDHRLQSPYSFDEKRFSPAAKSISFMAMWSYGTSVVDTYYINSVELKNIDDKLLIDGINNNLSNNYYSKIQTDAAIKVATDSITSTVRTEITTVNNKVDNISIGDENLINLSEINPYNDATIDTSNYIKCGEVILTAYARDYSGIYIDFYNDAKPETYYVFSYDITALDSQPFRTIRGHMDTGFYTMKCCIDGVDIKKSYQEPYTFSDSSVRKHHVEVYVKLKDEMTDNRRIFIQPNYLAKQTSERYKIENLKIVEGNKYTNGWSPAPSDQQLQIDNIQVGGRNLLKDTANFHNNGRPSGSKDGWLDSWHSTVESEKYNGLTVRSLKNVSTTKEMCNYYFTGFNLGDTYTLSFWAKGTIDRFRCYFYGDSGYVKARAISASIPYYNNSVYADGYCSFVNPKITNWTRIWVTWELDSVGDINIAKRVLIRTDEATSGDLYVCGMKLEKGNKPTDWSPAPEDMATAEQAQQAQNDANEANSKADSNEHRVSVAESTIKQLSDSISMMVTDSNGSSMMTQTSDGWTFNIGAITNAIDSATNNIDNLSGSLDQTKNVVNNLNNLANDLSKKTAYINMTTDETGAPCIELGKTGNAFKVRITNTSVDFIQGSSKIAYVSNQALFIEKAIIKSELQIGETKGFIWKTRSNGNMGLRWFG